MMAQVRKIEDHDETQSLLDVCYCYAFKAYLLAILSENNCLVTVWEREFLKENRFAFDIPCFQAKAMQYIITLFPGKILFLIKRL
jgi:hypothetical protein